MSVVKHNSKWCCMYIFLQIKSIDNNICIFKITCAFLAMFWFCFCFLFWCLLKLKKKISCLFFNQKFCSIAGLHQDFVLCLRCNVGHILMCRICSVFLILISLNEVCWYKLDANNFKRITLFYFWMFFYTVWLLHDWQHIIGSLNFSLGIYNIPIFADCKMVYFIVFNVLFGNWRNFSGIIFSSNLQLSKVIFIILIIAHL